MRILLLPLAGLVAFFNTATAAELTDQQKRLLAGLPSVERVLAAVPERLDPLENLAAQERALGFFQGLADSIADLNPPPPGELYASEFSRYSAARLNARLATMKSIGAWGHEQKSAAAEHKLMTIAQSENADPQKFYAYRAQLYEALLTGELRDYAMGWHERNGGTSLSQSLGIDPSRWVSTLPPGIRKPVETLLAVPSIVWVGLLLAWVAYGLSRRTGPFGLDPNDPLTLLRGKKRRQMAFHDGIITNNDVQERVTKQVSYKVNEYGQRQGPDHVQHFRSLTQHLNLRDLSGRNIPITLVGNVFNVHNSQRVLAVYDKKSGRWLFLCNRDNGVVRYMPYLMSYYRLRPLIFIPLWSLAVLAANLVSPQAFAVTLLGFPLVYFFVTWHLNRRRWKKLENELIPAIIEATRRM